MQSTPHPTCEQFHHSKETLYPLAVTPHFPRHPFVHPKKLLTCFHTFACSEHFTWIESYKICLLCLVPFIEHVFKSHPCSSIIVAVHFLSHVGFFAVPWTVACQASLSFTISWSLLKLMSIEWVTPSNHLILCCPILLLPSIFPSVRIFPNESALHIRWPEYWCFSFSLSPSSEYSEFISFRIDWLNLLAVQGILNGLFQHHNSKASILWHSAFFMIQLSHPNMTTGKNHNFDYMNHCQQSDVSAF